MSRRDWDAATYDRVADPMFRWGVAVLERLELRGDERVLDAGCGSGRVTEVLLGRLPAGHVVALDASPAMLEQARRRLGDAGAGRVTFVRADLARPLPVEPPVDHILSTATFHWVLDHDAMFANLAAVLAPGGRLAAQSGGRGNVASVREAVRGLGVEAPGPRYRFASPEETARRLEAAGFVDVECWLHDEPTAIEPGEPFETYLQTVCLRPYLDALPPEGHAAFAREVARAMGRPQIDYVRLNILARRGPAAP